MSGTTNEDLGRIQEQFRRQAEAYERLAVVADSAGHRALVALTQPSERDRVLDVACGPAFLSMAFAERSAEVVGVDGTDVFLDHARREAGRGGLANLRLLLGDVERLPLAAAKFDRVVCRAAFHHFPRPRAVLAEMVRVAAPGAKLLIADLVGSEDPAKAALHDEIERLCDPTHVRALGESEFDRLFAEQRLRVVFRGRSKIDYTVREWMSHGGPSPDRARAIEDKMRASIDGDRAGLFVREEAGQLAFSHTGVAFLLERSGT
ncbi:MAG: class I SAM-dependent methyltransferase [Candidatus Binatia bacterium]